MLSFYDIEYTDPDGKPKKARTQAVNGLHTEELLREHFDRHKQFGAGAVVNKITKLTDSAQVAAAAASRPELPSAVVKQIQAAENAASPPTAEPAPPAPNASQPAPAQA